VVSSFYFFAVRRATFSIWFYGCLLAQNGLSCDFCGSVADASYGAFVGILISHTRLLLQ
jgi:hypothetical protein